MYLWSLSISFCFKKSYFPSFISLSGIVLAVYLFIRFGVGKVFFVFSGIIPITQLTPFQRILNTPAVLFYYLKTFFYPATLNVYQLWIVNNIDFSNFYLLLIIDLVVFLIIIFIAYKLFKTNKKIFSVYTFFMLWFFSGIFFHSQIFPLDMTVADRWFYFPMVGILGIVGVGIEEIKVNAKYRAIVLFSAFLIITILSLRTIVRNTNWYDELTLFSHDSKTQDNFEIENYLGLEYGQESDYKSALSHELISISMYPLQVSYANAAYDYEQLGNFKMANDFYYKALSTKTAVTANEAPVAGIYEGLLKIAIKTNDEKNVQDIMKQALNFYPNDPFILIYAAIIEYDLNNKNEAINLISQAKSIAPGAQQVINIYNQIISNQPVDLIVKNSIVFTTN